LHVFGVQVGTVQVPCVEPGGFTHPPAQQSPVEVQEPPAGTHAELQTYLPRPELKVQGLPQQSALVAQAVPSGTGVEQVPTKWTRQRGRPSSSFAQQFSGVLWQFCPGGCPTVSQQLLLIEHELRVAVLQRLPGAAQDPALLHRPN
jgi:hypothetical protein